MGIARSSRIPQLYYGLDSKIVVLQLSKPFTRRKLSEIYTNILERYYRTRGSSNQEQSRAKRYI